MKILRRVTLINIVFAALLAPSLASASPAHHPVRCRTGYHHKTTRRHHKRRVVCVKNRRNTPKRAPAKPVTAPKPVASTNPAPPTTPTAPASPPTTALPPTVTPPTTTPPPPPPPPLSSDLSPQTATVKSDAMLRPALAQANYDIAVQGQYCGPGNVVSRGFPSVGNPAGSYVWTVDELWARPENSSVWHMDAIGDYYWNGTYRPVFDWYDYRTGQVGGSGYMDSWNINSGWYVTIVQYVWVNGAWYNAVPSTGCAF